MHEPMERTRAECLARWGNFLPQAFPLPPLPLLLLSLARIEPLSLSLILSAASVHACRRLARYKEGLHHTEEGPMSDKQAVNEEETARTFG